MPEPRAKSGFKLIEGGAGPQAVGPSTLRPERRDEIDDAAIWALMAQGKLPMEAANDRWAPHLPIGRWSLIRVAFGAAVWGLAFVGLWSIVT